ncbi:MAG TPA: cobalamin-binding protein [Candidatus Atribacteria bacterium]|nr:cobalamin-binding protein [Candidatus Atribacteria bacterium]
MKLSQKLFLIFASLVFFLNLFLLMGSSATINYPITIIDDTGTEVTIPREPQRIISTAPSNTEILFDLGLQEKIVGITNYCNFPEETKNIEKIGEISPLNFEKIISLNPDLILAYAGFQLKEIPRLRELGLTTIVLEPLTLEDTFNSIKMIARVCGISEKGSSLVDHLSQRVHIIQSKVSTIPFSDRPKIFVGSTSETIFTPGAGTLFHELITLAGGQNIASDLAFWKQVNPEYVAQAEPDIIIIPVGVMNQGDESKIKNNISQRSGWSNIPAIKKQKIFVVNEDLFYRAVPRLVEGLELLYRIFYE